MSKRVNWDKAAEQIPTRTGKMFKEDGTEANIADYIEKIENAVAAGASVSLTGSLPSGINNIGKITLENSSVGLENNIVAEQLTQADAVADVLTFSDNISAIEIYHEETTSQIFVVNGLSLSIAAYGWRSPVGGTPAATVTIPNGIDCVVTRLV